MKFIYFVILGLMLFNGVLIVTAGIFNTGLEGSATNVTSEYGSYGLGQNSSSILSNVFSSNALGAWGAFSVIALVGVIGSILTKNYVVVAVALFLGIVTALYLGVSSVLLKIYSNVYTNALITLIGIAIGILVIYNVIEMFSGTAGDV